MESSDEVHEGDTVILSSGEEPVEADVTKVWDDGTFMLEWHTGYRERGQVFRPSVFERTAFVEHVPGPRQQTITEAAADV